MLRTLVEDLPSPQNHFVLGMLPGHQSTRQSVIGCTDSKAHYRTNDIVVIKQVNAILP